MSAGAPCSVPKSGGSTPQASTAAARRSTPAPTRSDRRVGQVRAAPRQRAGGGAAHSQRPQQRRRREVQARAPRRDDGRAPARRPRWPRCRQAAPSMPKRGMAHRFSEHVERGAGERDAHHQPLLAGGEQQHARAGRPRRRTRPPARGCASAGAPAAYSGGKTSSMTSRAHQPHRGRDRRADRQQEARRAHEERPQALAPVGPQPRVDRQDDLAEEHRHHEQEGHEPVGVAVLRHGLLARQRAQQDAVDVEVDRGGGHRDPGRPGLATRARRARRAARRSSRRRAAAPRPRPAGACATMPGAEGQQVERRLAHAEQREQQRASQPHRLARRRPPAAAREKTMSTAKMTAAPRGAWASRCSAATHSSAARGVAPSNPSATRDQQRPTPTAAKRALRPTSMPSSRPRLRPVARRLAHHDRARAEVEHVRQHLVEREVEGEHAQRRRVQQRAAAAAP